jgi:hypothetical protein
MEDARALVPLAIMRLPSSDRMGHVPSTASLLSVTACRKLA